VAVSGNRSGTEDMERAIFSNSRWTVRLAVVPRLGLGGANLACTVGDNREQMPCARAIVSRRCVEVPVSVVFNFQYAQEGVSALLKLGIA